jgi:biopolymer transport protein ExbD
VRNRKLVFDNRSGESEINVSPLIDIVFILLIFFIVTTVFVEETGVEVQKPRAASAQQLERHSILIAITAEGQIVYGGKNIGIRGVGDVVRRLLRKEDMPVIVQADRKAPIDLYAKVHDEATLAGAEQINLATQK